MIVSAAFLLVILGASVRGLRSAGGEPRWPFLVSTALSGTAVVALTVAAVTVVTAGRDTWNGWVGGSESSETATLVMVLVVGPILLVICLALLALGTVLRAWSRRSVQ